MPEFGQALLRECARDWKPYYVNYNRLKGWIKEMQSNGTKEAYKVFFEELETNLKRVDAFYVAQEAALQAGLEALCSGNREERESEARGLQDSIKKLRCFAEMNVDGFRKITKKFDKKVGAPSSELPDGLQTRMLEVVKTYHFSDAEQRLDKLTSAMDAWWEGHEDISPPLMPRKRSMLDLGVPFLPPDEEPEDAKARVGLLRKSLAWLLDHVNLMVITLAVAALAVASPTPKFNQQSYLVIWVTGVVLSMLVRQHAPDSVLMAATILLTVCGVLKTDEAWQAFSNQVVLSVAGLGVIASVVGETGVIDLVFKVILGKPTNMSIALLRLMLPSMLLNIGISNTCVMSCLLPVIDTWSKEIGIHKAFFLMPLSYFLLITGVFAVFSTSTNLVAQGLLIAHDQPPFSNFALALPVAASATVALVYLLVATPIILRRFSAPSECIDSPARHQAAVAVTKRMQNRYDVRVQIVGRTLEEQTLQSSGILDMLSGKIGDVRSCERYGSHLGLVHEDLALKLDDILWLRTSVEGIAGLFHTPGVLFLALDLSEDYATLDPSSRQLVEAVLDKESPLIGHRIGDCRKYRPEYNCPVVAYRAFNVQQGVDSPTLKAFPEHGPETKKDTKKKTSTLGSFKRQISGDGSGKVGADTEVRLMPGDHIILNAPLSFYGTWKESTDFVVLRKVTTNEPEVAYTTKAYVAPLSGCILLGLIGLVASSTMELLQAVFVAITALVFAKCTTMDSVVRGVKLRTVLTIIGAFGLGKAIGKVHVAEVLSDILIFALGPLGNRGLLVAIFAATVALGVIFHGTAVVVLMYPICVEVSNQKGIPIHQIIAVLCISVSCQMLSPISYQTNLMAYSTGGYQFADFTKLGAGLVLCIAAVSIPMCEFCFPG